jgi:hypothetical protein
LEPGVLNDRGLRRESERLRLLLDKRLLLSPIELTSELWRLVKIEAVLVLLNIRQDVILLVLCELSSLNRNLRLVKQTEICLEIHKIIVNLRAYHNKDIRVISWPMKLLQIAIKFSTKTKFQTCFGISTITKEENLRCANVSLSVRLVYLLSFISSPTFMGFMVVSW